MRWPMLVCGLATLVAVPALRRAAARSRRPRPCSRSCSPSRRCSSSTAGWRDRMRSRCSSRGARTRRSIASMRRLEARSRPARPTRRRPRLPPGSTRSSRHSSSHRSSGRASISCAPPAKGVARASGGSSRSPSPPVYRWRAAPAAAPRALRIARGEGRHRPARHRHDARRLVRVARHALDRRGARMRRARRARRARGLACAADCAHRRARHRADPRRGARNGHQLEPQPADARPLSPALRAARAARRRRGRRGNRASRRCAADGLCETRLPCSSRSRPSRCSPSARRSPRSRGIRTRRRSISSTMSTSARSGTRIFPTWRRFRCPPSGRALPANRAAACASPRRPSTSRATTGTRRDGSA